MKKRVFLIIIVVIITVGGIFIGKVLTEEKPFKNLSVNDISEATVSLYPPGTTLAVSNDEVKVLVDILRKVVIYNQDDSYNNYAGQAVVFNITKTDGTQLSINAYNPFIIIDGVGYKTKYEPCEELNRLGNNLRA